MGKFMQKERHKNSPAWLRGLEKFVEKHNKSDIDAVIRNYGGDRKVNAQAGYEIDEEKK